MNYPSIELIGAVRDYRKQEKECRALRHPYNCIDLQMKRDLIAYAAIRQLEDMLLESKRRRYELENVG